MAVTDDVRLRGRTRWSMAAKCPRMCAYGLLGADPEPPTDRTKRLWRRGRQLGADVADDFAAKYGEDNIVREKAIAWPDTGMPLGELHTDVFVKDEAMAVEVKSSKNPASILDDAIFQLGGEIRFDDEAEVGCLAVVDPTGWNDTAYLPVLLTDELTEKVEGIAQQVVDATRTGDLPVRVCEKPSDGHGKFCPFINICFADWQKPDPRDLDRPIAEIALRMKEVQDRERAAKAVVAELEAERKGYAEQLAAWELMPGVEYAGAGTRVKRTQVADSEKLSLTNARKAGIWTPEDTVKFGPFIKASGGHDRFTVIRDAEATTVAEDFGSEAPWTDEDLLG